MAFLNCRYGAYLLDIFNYDGINYVALNNFPGAQNSLAKLNDELDCIEIISHIGNSDNNTKFDESGIMRREDGSWMAILREERKGNYYFSYSENGCVWTEPREESFVLTGTSSKPTLDNFNGFYIMGWNDTTRSCFRFQYSKDCQNWIDLYEIYSPTTFQYPSLEIYNGTIYYTATIGNKEQIVFGELYLKEFDGKLYIDDSFVNEDEKLFEDLSSYNDLGYIQGNPNGSRWHMLIKRDNLGVYLHAETNQYDRGNKALFSIDIEGKLANRYNKNNLLIRFVDAHIEVQSTNISGAYVYKDLKIYSGVKWLRETSGEHASYDVFIPYDAIKEIAPLSTFSNNEAPLYFTASAAVNFDEYSLKYQGFEPFFANPSLYLELSYDNEVKVRDDYNLLTYGVRSSKNGACWIVSIMRNDDGVYLTAKSVKSDVGDKFFVMLDTQGISTTVNSDSNLMFRFNKTSSGWENQVQSRHTLNSTTRGYKNLSEYPEVSYTLTEMVTHTRVDMFIPYEVITDIAPNTTFSIANNIYFAVYGANGAYTEHLNYKGNIIMWTNPTTYLILSSDNQIILK